MVYHQFVIEGIGEEEVWLQTCASCGKLLPDWWACFPGCMPDGDPSGLFDSEQEAIDDARNV